MTLKELLATQHISAGELGKALTQSTGRLAGHPYSRPAMAQLINHGVFPKSTPETELKQQINGFLTRHGVAGAELATLWDTAATVEPDNNNGNDLMLPKKEELTQAAKKHFKFRRDPFGDVEEDSQMFLPAQVLDAKESLLDVMKHGGFMALVGESGAGKSTLLDDCEEHLHAYKLPVTLIKPPITGMDTTKDRGAPMKARAILLMILDAIAPHARRYAELPRLTAEVIRQLSERKIVHQQFCLVIDDAHRLNGHTLNHLKDFYEFKMGRKRLLGIILLGQPELAQRLDPHNPDVVQITQRCRLEILPPLVDAATIRGYLDTRLKAVGSSADAVFAPDAYEAIRAKLAGVVTGSGRKAIAIDRAYPLAINNTVTHALNMAAQVMDETVDAQTIRGL